MMAYEFNQVGAKLVPEFNILKMGERSKAKVSKV
jgi:hypothetical protein